MALQLPDNLHIARLSHKKWEIKNFRPQIQFLSKLTRPKEMTKGLWELPLYQDISQGWKPTEFYSTDQFQEIGGIKSFEKLHFHQDLAPCFQWAYDLKALGISVYRLRILALAPKSIQHKHIDQISKRPILRLHLPLLTHSQARLDYFSESGKGMRYHLPADGHAHFINVAQKHRVCNFDEKRWRLHLVCDIRAMNDKLKLDQLRY